MSATNYLGLNIPDKNSKGRVVTEVFEPNFTKLDQNAEVVDRDKNAIWGGLDGGGKIEDPTVVKEVGKRYIGADGKAYICLVPSNINNSTNYTPCNVVDNLDKLQNLFSFGTKDGIYWEINQLTGRKRCCGTTSIEAKSVGTSPLVKTKLPITISNAVSTFGHNSFNGRVLLGRPSLIGENTIDFQVVFDRVGSDAALYWIVDGN